MVRAESEGGAQTEANRERLESTLAHFVVAICSIVLVLKEFATPLEESSRGVILEMLRVGSLSSNYPFFGDMLELITNAFGRDHLAIEVIAHALFVSSAAVWVAVMLKLIGERNQGKRLAAILVAILILNPVMTRFNLFAWRQSLSLAIFIFGVLAVRRPFVKMALIAISVIVHQGMAPVVLFFAVFSAIPATILWMVVPVSLVSMVVLYAAFPFHFLPAWMPFRLQLSDLAALSAADPSFNNAAGAIVEKYVATLVLPLSALILGRRQLESRWIKLALALSLPLIIGNFIPGANRFLYYSVFSATVCIPIIFSEFIHERCRNSIYWAVPLAVAMNSTVLLSMQS
jgi:hypothetical protein